MIPTGIERLYAEHLKRYVHPLFGLTF